MAYLMLSRPIPARVQTNAFTNEVGRRKDASIQIVGISATAGQPLELIVETVRCRFYDIPLRFFGDMDDMDVISRQYAPTPSAGQPQFTPEDPRDVMVYKLRESEIEPSFGRCYGALTWDIANLTLLLVVLTDGTVLFWPPHKLRWDREAQPLPAWTKRRYLDDIPELPGTHVEVVTRDEMERALSQAHAALGSETGWRSHGIGLIQKYVGDVRVHVWTPEAVKIGIEGGIHNHRYDFQSTVVCGRLRQEEWVGHEDKDGCGLWRQWVHNNETHEPRALDVYWTIEPRTRILPAGVAYSFKRTSWHRSIPVSPVVVTVMTRSGVGDQSSALIPRGIAPVNGQTVTQDVVGMLARARKHLGVL